MIYRIFWDTILRNLEGGAGGAGAGGAVDPAVGAGGAGNGDQGLVGKAAAIAGDAAKSAEVAAAAAAAEAAKSQPNGAAYYPDGLPETLRGTTNNETIDKLAKHVAELPKPPAKADDYKLELPPDFAKKFGELKGDDDQKVMGIWRQVAHKNGLSNSQYQSAFTDLYAALDQAGLIDNGPDPDVELEKLMPKEGEAGARKIEAAKIVNDTASWLKGLESKGALTKEQHVALAATMETANGIRAIQVLMSLVTKGGVVPPGGGGGGQQPSEHERAMAAMYPSMVKNT